MSEIELSDDVLVQCPEKGFQFRKVKYCLECKHYQGIGRATQNGVPIKGNTADTCQIICGRPITRKLVEISEG